MGNTLSSQSGANAVVVGVFCALTWTEFLRNLREHCIFRQAVEDSLADPADMEGLEHSLSYYREVWPVLWKKVEPRYKTLLAEHQARQALVVQEEARVQAMAAFTEELTENLVDALGLVDSDRERVESWIRRHPPAKSVDGGPYHELCDCERVDEWRYGEAFQRVALGHMPWVPKTFNIYNFLEMARVGWYQRVFLYLWGLYSGEAKAEQARQLASRRGRSAALAYLDADAKAVLELFKREQRQARGTPTRLPIDSELGLLLAAMRADLAGRFKSGHLQLENFLPERHVPEVARNILLQEIQSRGLTCREESRFFSPRARWVIGCCNHFLTGDLPWQTAVDPRIRRGLESGALENWEILLAFDEHAESWNQAAER